MRPPATGFKKFLIHKGERVGLAVAGIVALLLLVAGARTGLSVDRPSATAAEIKARASEVISRLQSDPPSPEAAAAIDPHLLGETPASPVLLEPYAGRNDFFGPSAHEDTGRLNPAVLGLVECQADVLRPLVRQFILRGEGQRWHIGVLETKEPVKPDKNAPDIKKMLDGRFPGAGLLLNRTHNEAALGTPNQRVTMVDADKLAAGARLAETVEPYRMVVVSAAFPYRRQIDAFRQAHCLNAIDELAAHPELLPRFLKFNVRRRALDGAGIVREEWTNLDLEAGYRPLLAQAVDIEPDPAYLKPVILAHEPLLMVRPKLALGSYPAVRLPAIQQALRTLEEKTALDPTLRPVAPLERRFSGQGINIFGSSDKPAEKRDRPRPEPGTQPRAPGVLIPEFCLVRFCDVTVRPGLTYQYQVQMRLANPNFGKRDLVAYPSLAEVKELAGDWAPREPAGVAVSGETFSYATGQKADRDTAQVQVQRWHPYVRLDPARGDTRMPIGLWCVADVPVRRGDPIAGYPRIDLPMWLPAREAFGFAPSQNPAKKGVPVDFRTEDILVDFEGGKLPNDRDSADMELLVLGADGKLRVRRASADAQDADRLRRATEWRKLSDAVRAGGKPGG